VGRDAWIRWKLMDAAGFPFLLFQNVDTPFFFEELTVPFLWSAYLILI
jgi:hypothetical protein